MTTKKYQLFTDLSDTSLENCKPRKIRLLSPIGGDLSLSALKKVKTINVYVVQASCACPAIRQIFIYDSIVLIVHYLLVDDLIRFFRVDSSTAAEKNKVIVLINNGSKAQQKYCRECLAQLSSYNTPVTKVFELPCISDDVQFFKNYVYLFARIAISSTTSSIKPF